MEAQDINLRIENVWSQQFQEYRSIRGDGEKIEEFGEKSGEKFPEELMNQETVHGDSPIEYTEVDLLEQLPGLREALDGGKVSRDAIEREVREVVMKWYWDGFYDGARTRTQMSRDQGS
mgnify:CR=1 FL=1|jgi:hypothetical protein